MLEELINQTKDFFEVHRKRKIGFLLGFLLGIVILIFGPFQTFFLIFCGIIGLYIGSRFDDGDDLVGHTLKIIEGLLPRRFQR